ncbi:hypothetical protein J2TS4_39320 [Paenibacillus sp. J2TS4]|nr:hypothetical protein J2TS4_39320 [Paenibacillus sp. J2TS4]
MFIGLPILILGAGCALLLWWEPEYAYVPPASKVVNPPSIKARMMGESGQEYDLWGQSIMKQETDSMQAGSPFLSSENGAIPIDEALLKLGRKALYKETFGNEVFLTDIVGIVDGPLTIRNMAKAIMKLKGQGTSNLRVELAEDATIGDKVYKKGDKVDTGIDVPKGAYAPLGMPVKFSQGRLKVGISCMACHATVDRETKQVIEGAPNSDLNAGLVLALATNSSAYFTHTDVDNVAKFIKDLNRTVPTSDNRTAPLPDPAALEKAVDENLVKWPPGNFDSTIDMTSNPSQIPDSFTKGGHPYGWSGFAAAGPFHGLSAFSNNVHAQNSDSLAQVEASPELFGLDKEVYLATLLQNSANPKFRYDPRSGLKPSEFFAKVDPTPGAPGVNEMIKPPSFPNLSLMAPDGLYISSRGFKVGEQVNGMAAYQNTLVPPDRKEKTNAEVLELGRTVFQRAQCISCHAGEAFTNNRVISSAIIGTEPSRAKALKKTEKLFGPTTMFTPDTPVPVPRDAKVLEVPTGHLDPEQMKLAFAWGDSPGGYKVKGLIGLRWTAPYLHDGGVAVGPDLTQVGIPGTFLQGVEPDPANSLRALIDKDLRQQVIVANEQSQALKEVHVAGIGHEHWVDSTTGFTKEQQDALIQYLLSLK